MKSILPKSTLYVSYNALSGGHQVIDITNGHFIHAGPFKGTGVSIYLSYNVKCRHTYETLNNESNQRRINHYLAS